MILVARMFHGSLNYEFHINRLEYRVILEDPDSTLVSYDSI